MCHTSNMFSEDYVLTMQYIRFPYWRQTWRTLKLFFRVCCVICWREVFNRVQSHTIHGTGISYLHEWLICLWWMMVNEVLPLPLTWHSPWKSMVDRWSFPFGLQPSFRGLVLGSVTGSKCKPATLILLGYPLFTGAWFWCFSFVPKKWEEMFQFDKALQNG